MSLLFDIPAAWIINNNTTRSKCSSRPEVSYHVDMGSVVIVQSAWRDLFELAEDLVVSGHVRGQDAPDHSFPDGFEHFGRELAKDVGRRILEDVERHRAVVILQRRDVVVPQGQLRPRINLAMGI